MSDALRHFNFLHSHLYYNEYVRLVAMNYPTKTVNVRSAEALEDYLTLSAFQTDVFMAVVKNCGDMLLSCSHVVWLDLDGYKYGVDTPSFELPPNLVVNSGRGTHAYWKLDAPQGLSGVEYINKQLIMQYQGDKACWNRERVLRVAGTTNSRQSDPARSLCSIEHMDENITSLVELSSLLSKHLPNTASSMPELSDDVGEDVPIANLPSWWQELLFKGGSSKYASVSYDQGRLDKSHMLFNIVNTAKKFKVPVSQLYFLYLSRSPLGMTKLDTESDPLTYLERIYNRCTPT